MSSGPRTSHLQSSDAKVRAMIKVALFSLSLLSLLACSESDPVATSYKKTMATSGAPQSATGTVTPGTGTGTGDATALALGQQVYAAKCASCHLALTGPSEKKGATEARITASATITAHASVKPFPTATEITALAAALK